MMERHEFKKIVNSWILFHGKVFKFNCDDPEVSRIEERKMYNKHLEIYFEGVNHLTATELENAYNQAAKSLKFYPKLPELLKYCRVKHKDNVVYFKPVPQSEESKRIMENALKGINKLNPDKRIKDNFDFMAKRWPGSDWQKQKERELQRAVKRSDS